MVQREGCKGKNAFSPFSTLIFQGWSAIAQFQIQYPIPKSYNIIHDPRLHHFPAKQLQCNAITPQYLKYQHPQNFETIICYSYYNTLFSHNTTFPYIIHNTHKHPIISYTVHNYTQYFPIQYITITTHQYFPIQYITTHNYFQYII